jgi:peroxiredoxin
MTKSVALTLGCLLSIFLFGCPSSHVKHPGTEVIQTGDLFPAIPLQTPSDPEDRRYLGLSEDETFTLDKIKGNLVLVEMMNVHCSSCRTQAPEYNKLYALIESDPKTKGQIKMLAIAAGNGDEEVKEFRDKYKVPFPLVPDPAFAMHRAIGSSPTPFAIYVRQDTSGRMGRVVDTHLGPIFDHKDLFKQLAGMATMDLAAIGKQGREKEAKTAEVKPILTEKELEGRVESAFESMGGPVNQFEKVSMKDSKTIYTAIVKRRQGPERFFAEVVNRSVPCDVCHDARFIYVFDSTGKVVGFTPIELTKYGNKPWDETDLSKLRSRVLGRYIFKSVVFDPKVDAIASATITSAVVLDSLSRGEAILEELKKRGMIQ